MNKTLIYLLIIILLFICGCSQTFYSQGRSFFEKDKYDLAIESFYKEIAENPQNANAWRELGVTFFKQGNLLKAEDALEQANLIKPDARMHVFFGLIYEKQKQYDKAVSAYATSLNLNPNKETKKIITAHIDELLLRKFTTEVNISIENEQKIQTDSISDNSIAVVNFDGSKLDPDYAPIAFGLAEFTSADLAKVKSLNVIERLKIDVILDELKLSESGYIEKSSAPRVGRLLGSGKIITGSILGIGEENFRLDGMIINTVDSTLQKSTTTEGAIADIFSLQKQFVFDILEKLGITITTAERDAIQEVPTESYLAFLAFSRGLYYDKKGMFDAAQQEYNNALSLDGGFQTASSQLQHSMNQAVSTGYEASVANLEMVAVSDFNINLGESGLDASLSTLINNAGFIPSNSSRQTTIAQPNPGETGRVIIVVDFDNE